MTIKVMFIIFFKRFEIGKAIWVKYDFWWNYFETIKKRNSFILNCRILPSKKHKYIKADYAQKDPSLILMMYSPR